MSPIEGLLEFLHLVACEYGPAAAVVVDVVVVVVFVSDGVVSMRFAEVVGVIIKR